MLRVMDALGMSDNVETESHFGPKHLLLWYFSGDHFAVD